MKRRLGGCWRRTLRAPLKRRIRTKLDYCLFRQNAGPSTSLRMTMFSQDNDSFQDKDSQTRKDDLNSAGDVRSRAVVCLSGGMDSTVCAALAARECEVYALHFSYGQRTERREFEAAAKIARLTG